MAQEQENNEGQGNRRPETNNSFTGGMNKDLSETVMKPGMYLHARNATPILPDGMTGLALSTECANVAETTISYTIIGRIQLEGDLWAIFSTNNTISEIGLYNESTGSYVTQLNDSITITTINPLTGTLYPGMGFKTTNLITGAARRNFDCGYDVYWADNGLNFNRMWNTTFMYPNPWVQNCTTVASCITCVNTNIIDVEQLRLSPQFSIPCLKLAKSSGSGTLLNGSYQVALRFAINGIPCTDFVALSNVQSIFAHGNSAGAVVLQISGISSETTVIFPEMEVVVISMYNLQVQAKRLGIYSSTQQTIYIDNLNQELENISLKLLPVSNPIIDKSDAIYTVSNYLLQVGTYEKPEFNYQPLANQIQAKWAAVAYPDVYYHQGGLDGFPMNVGYLRGESYALYIRWCFTTGDKSASYPLSCTSTGFSFSIGGPSVGDGSSTLYSGNFDPYISTEIYPNDKPNVWNANVPGHPEWDLCGKPIRHFKFPDQSSIGGTSLSHFNPDGRQNTISVMGIVFSNIQPPVDNNGNVIPNIQGYEILRAVRNGNETILAKGMVNHMREYQNPDGTFGLYQNYPYDDLHADRFLTTSQTIGSVGGVEPPHGWQGNELTFVSPNIVSFHSPDTVFQHPYLGRGTLELVQGVAGIAVGTFDIPYKHPMFKLLTDLANDFSLAIGLLQDIIKALAIASGGGLNMQLAATNALPINVSLGLSAYPDGTEGLLGEAAYTAGIIAETAIFLTLLPIQTKIIQQQIMNIVNGLVPGVQYARQYDSHGFYNNAVGTGRGDIPITDYEYVRGQVQWFAGQSVNNIYRNDYVALQLNSGLPDFPAPYSYDGAIGGTNVHWQGYGTTVPGCDHSNFTLGQAPSAPLTTKILGPFTSPIVSWYGAYRVPMAAQYGQIDSTKQVPIGCMQAIPIPSPRATYQSGVMFGGDTYINRYTEKNPFFYFNDWLVNVPEDFQYDYTAYENVPFPRYWVNNSKIYYDFWNAASENWHLDEVGSSTVAGAFWLKNGFFYLFNNGVRDFYVESSVNVGYRDWEDTIQKMFYDPYGFSDLSQMFRSDIIKSDTLYKYDYSLSADRFFNQYLSWSKCLDRDYDPLLAYSCFAYYPRRIVYSLPQEEELKKDNWKVFLPNNYKDFSSKVTSIKDINKTGAIILLWDQAPMSFTGIESIKSNDDTEYVVGNGNLFNQTLQSITNVDDVYQYASCQNRLAVISTPYGVFWVSQNSGKIFQFAPNKTYYNQGESTVDITVQGLKYWASLYMPSQLLLQFPNYPLYDNPVAGIGMQLIYDNINEIVYICKKDYQLLPQYLSQVELIGNQFVLISHKGTVISLNDPTYFINCSWTVSYFPAKKQFIGFHDWIPALSLQTKNHFLTTDTVFGNGNILWRHNKVTNLFCNFYGQSFPFEVEYPIITGSSVTTLENIEVFLEAYLYNSNGYNKFHSYKDFFDYCLVYNSEQSTLPMQLVEKPWDDPYGAVNFPFLSAAGLITYYTKQEQKYRIAKGLVDYTNDRGQFDLDITQLITTLPNGYTWEITPGYLDSAKPSMQLKKIRHFKSRIFLRKVSPGNVALCLYFTNTKFINSPR